MRWWIVIAVVAASAGSILTCMAGIPDDTFAQHFDLPRDPESVLRNVLSRREFAEDPVSNWLRRIWDRAVQISAEIVRWIVSRIPSMGPVKIRGDILGTIGTALLVGAAAVILILVGWRLAAVLAKRSRRRDAAHRPPLESDDGATPAGLRRRALSEADQGNYGLALSLFFRYALLRLDEDGLLAYHQGKTNRELLAALKADEVVRGRVAEMVFVFNRVRYGRAPCDRDEYERFLVLCRYAVGGV